MELSKIKFRNANAEDITSIIEIEHASFSSFICESEEVFLERVNTFPEGFRVMEYDGRVIGYISSEIWSKVNKYSAEHFTLGHSIKYRHDPEGSELYISSMGILPQYRSKGLGKLLFGKFIRHAAKEFQNIDSIVLIVSEKWLNARRIYKSEGFIEIMKIEGFFKDEKDEKSSDNGIIMRRRLT